MSKTIDEKVVSMQFDNKNFEANVSTSLSTLDKLKKKLNLDGASKGLENINSAVKNFDVSPLSSGVEAVKNKFSAMEVMGVTALANITNSAVNAGKGLVSAFTIDPVKTGFQEYELKMGSVQTIMASTGESLATVNKYLDELNTYSDKTIYSFSDMTTNIGKFTNAGVKLEDAVMAIKGISNEAAVSGANTNEASRAMYNFSQALSSGYVKLIDWKSIENANMATVEFKQQLIESAVACGTLTKSAEGMYTTGKHTIDATHEFNDSLQDGWMTSEVLVKTLKDYADETTAIGKKAFSAAQDVKTFSMMMDTLKEAAQSGWAQTWELIFGDFEEAKTLWTELSEKFGSIINKSSKNRNSILAGALNSNWDKLVGKINDAGIATEDFEEKLKETAKEHGIAIDDLIEKEGSLAKVISSGKISGSVIIETIKKFAGAEKEASTSVDDLTGKLEYYQNVVDKVWRGDYKNADTGRYELLKKEGYDYIAVQELVNRTVDGHRLTMEDLVAVQAEMSDVQLENIGYTEEQVKAIRQLSDEAEKTGTPINDLIKNLEKPSGRELLIDSIRNSIQAISVALGAVKGAWKDVFPTSLNEKASMLYKTIEAIHKFTEWLILSDSAADNLKKTFRGLFAAFDIVRTIVGGGLSVGFRILKAVLDAFNIDILSATANIGDAIYEFRNWLLENNIVVKSIEKLISMISKAVTKVKDFADEFAKIPAVSSAITKVKDDVSGAFSEIHDRFSNGGEVITAFIDRCSKLDGISLENIETVLVDFCDNVLGYFFNTEGLFDNFGASLTNLKDTIISNLEQSVDGFAEFKNKVVEAFEYIKSKLDKIQLGHIIAIGTGIALIAFVNKFWDIAKLIGSPLKTIADSISGFFNSIGGVLKGFTLNLKAKALIKIAIAIAVLVASVALLTRLDAVSLWNAVGALAVLSGVLVGIMIALDKVSVNTYKMIAVGLAIAAMGSSLLFIGAALKIIATMSLEDVGKGLLVITSFGIIAAGLVAVSKLAGEHASKAGKMIQRIAKAFILLSIAMKIIASMSDEDAAKGLVIIGILELLAIGLVAVSKLAGDSSDSAGKMIQRIAKAFLMLAIVIKIISLMNENDLEKGLVIISTLELLVIGLVAVSKLAGEHASKAGTMIMKISAAFIVLAIAMAIISTINAKGLKQAIKAISAVSVCFAALIAVSKFASGAEAAIGKIAIVLAIMAISLAGLSMIDPSRLTTATIALSAVIGMFTLASSVAPIASAGAKGLVAVIGTMIILATAIGALATYIPQVQDFVNNAVPIFAKLGEAIGSFIGGIIGGSLSGITDSLPKIGSDIQTFFNSIGSVDSASIDSAKSIAEMLLLITGAEFLDGISKFIGSNGIDQFGSRLVSFGGSMSLFASTIKDADIDDDQVEAAANAGKLMAALESSIPRSGGNLQSFIGEHDMTKLGTDMVSFASSMILFSDTIKDADIDDDQVEAVANAGKLMAALEESIPRTGGNLQSFIGDHDMIKLGTDMVSFGNSMILFSDTIKDGNIDEEQVEVAARCGEMMAALEESIPATDGFFQAFTGEHDMATFGANLVSFGGSITLFAAAIKDTDIDEAKVEAAANAGSAIAKMSEGIPKTGSIFDVFTGNGDLSAFSTDIANFGKGIKNFSDSISGSSYTSITTGLDSAELMVNFMKENGNNIQDLADIILYINNMTWFDTGFVNLGNCVPNFSDSVKTINAGNIENAISAINGMIKIATTISIAPSSNDKITAFGTQIVDLAKATKAFIAEAAGIDGSQLSIAVAQIKNMSQGLNEASSKSLSGFAKAFDNATKSSKSAASRLVKAVENSFTNVKNADFSKAGKTVISRFADGMTSNSGKAKNAATTVSSDVSLSLKSKKSGAYDAGKALVTGFANGISSNTYIAKNAAREMAKASVKVAKKALDINSPSKVFRKIGKSVPEGFAQGIDRLGGLVDNSATNMCKSAVTQTGKAIARISNAINDNVDAEPTIRPVLDLSNVANGASAINGLFSTNPSIGVLSNVGSISSMMNRRQNEENNDMVTAINKLNSKLDNISGNTYTMNGITYDDGSNISDAVRALIRATRVERRA